MADSQPTAAASVAGNKTSGHAQSIEPVILLGRTVKTWPNIIENCQFGLDPCEVQAEPLGPEQR